MKKIEQIDTGHALNDTRRKNILKQALHFIEFTVKTNFYRNNKSSFSFRLDPKYLDALPYDRKERFPELPYGIFFIRSLSFIGFNIRFKDLARGGVRTVIPDRMEAFVHERNNIFSEAYNLAYTQQKKNKDIPEGGAKTAILLEPFEIFAPEEEIYRKEMEADGVDPAVLEEKLKIYRRDQRLSYLYACQRSFVDSLMTLVNCDESGTLRAKSVIDYWKPNGERARSDVDAQFESHGDSADRARGRKRKARCGPSQSGRSTLPTDWRYESRCTPRRTKASGNPWDWTDAAGHYEPDKARRA